MTFLDIPDFEEEFWTESWSFSAELDDRMRNLGDKAAELHAFCHGPGGDWDGRPDFYCCFGGK